MTYFTHFCAGIFGDLLFRKASNNRAKVLPCVSMFKKAVICLIEKRYVLDKLHSGVNYNAIDSEISVNEDKDVFE